MVSQQCKVEFKIGGYKDDILCDVIPMGVFHVLLGRPWKYDRMSYMMEGKILTPLKRMVISICYCE
jgi:hypothetical protein